MDECLEIMSRKPQIVSKGLNEDVVKYDVLKNWTNISRASLPRFAKAMAALDRHLKHNGSKLSMAKDRYWSSSRRRPWKTAKCNKSTYRSRWRAGMEKSRTWRSKSKVTQSSCYNSWAHGTAVLITKCAKARLSRHFSGECKRRMHVRNSGKIIKKDEFLSGICTQE